MKSKIFMMLAFAVFSFSCTVNVNQPNTTAANAPISPSSNANVVSQSPWSAVVCSSRANSVTLSAGASDTTGEIFATWQQNAAQREFTLPASLQRLSRIYFKASASDKNQVEMCVLYDGKAKSELNLMMTKMFSSLRPTPTN